MQKIKSSIKIIITGVTGFVGEGVLRECIADELVAQILVVGRKSCGLIHQKLQECLVADFNNLDMVASQLMGYDACFFCAGVSSAGLSEEQYSLITYDTTLNFARAIAFLNPEMVFNFVSGRRTDSTGSGKIMWARVKGKTENALAKLDFHAQYNFRPGAMVPIPGQKNVKWFYQLAVKLIQWVAPATVVSIKQVGRAMIHAAIYGYGKQVLEVADIKELADR